MKIRMIRTYEISELYETIEINKEDYPGLEGMSDEEAIEYINDNMYEFEVKGSDESNIVDEIMFGLDIVREKNQDENFRLMLEK
jgi:hypothetical protein